PPPAARRHRAILELLDVDLAAQVTEVLLRLRLGARPMLGALVLGGGSLLGLRLVLGLAPRFGHHGSRGRRRGGGRAGGRRSSRPRSAAGPPSPLPRDACPRGGRDGAGWGWAPPPCG